MTKRVTKQMIENALQYFCTCSGERIADSYNDVGGLEVDYAACYGGYIINRIANEKGAVSMAFGQGRRSASDMLDFLSGMSYYFQSRGNLELIKSWEAR